MCLHIYMNNAQQCVWNVMPKAFDDLSRLRVTHRRAAHPHMMAGETIKQLAITPRFVASTLRHLAESPEHTTSHQSSSQRCCYSKIMIVVLSLGATGSLHSGRGEHISTRNI